MPTTDEIIEQLESLPLEGRVHIVDSLLRTLNQPDRSIDALWACEAQRRLDEMRSGAVRGVPADAVFAKARKRFST